jgi:hypothetical protein
VKELTVKNVPSGARIEVRCIGKTCPFKTKRATAKSGTAKLLSLLKNRRGIAAADLVRAMHELRNSLGASLRGCS